MPKITINDQEYEVAAGLTVLQALESVGYEIPRFCYHERLSIAGNCRMCLVEVAPGPPKPQASCALPVAEGQKIRTDSPMVDKARKGVMEFLLINHPLDCPICDQGGECDLQDQAFAYGANASRYREAKRAVADKYMGPLIKTVMTRCIHCTRCVRFATEVAGVDEIGLLNRGTYAEISTLEQAVSSELSGNLVDLCPVGALTSKPYQFHARSWELTPTPSIDVTDAQGANIRVDTRGNEVMRILPRLHEDINEEWITDKARHSCDGLKRQRLDTPYLRGKDGRLQPCDWSTALSAAASKIKALKPEEIATISGNLADVESLYALKKLWALLGSPHLDCRQDGNVLSGPAACSWRFNSRIAGIDQMDALLIIGSDIGREAPVLNARIRRHWLKTGLPIAVIGPQAVLTYDATYLGAGPNVLDQLLKDIEKKKTGFAKHFAKASRPGLILGQGALARDDGRAVLSAARAVAEVTAMVQKPSKKDPDGWNGFNVLLHQAGLVNGLELGCIPEKGGLAVDGIAKACESGKIKLAYLFGADELTPVQYQQLSEAFVIYQGHHGDRGAEIADLILPGAAYTEKDATYVNIEGRVQQTMRAAYPPGDARQDWAILRALAGALGLKPGFDHLGELRQQLYQDYPMMAELDTPPPVKWKNFGRKGTLKEADFTYPVTTYYMTDVIGRASETMAECTRSSSGEPETLAANADVEQVAAYG